MKKLNLLMTVISVVLLIAFSCNTPVNKSGNQINSLLLSADKFDTVINGQQVELFTLVNPDGIAVQLTNYGATIVSVITPDKDGNYADVTLGYQGIAGYLTDSMNLGCIVGPYANRIANGKFIIDGVTYQLETNDGPNSLHSGSNSFSKKIWSASQEGNKVTMIYKAKELEAGFPGEITATAVYTLTPENKLELLITAQTDKKTVVNLTNHAYFNLAGEGSGTVLNHQILIYADSITPVDSLLIPTGELSAVENTPFDFRTSHVIGERINNREDQQILLGNGYDHNWVLNNKTGELSLASKLEDPESKRFLELYTNQPGLQFYSGNFMNGRVTGKSGKIYNFRDALALEPQFFPDSPNKAGFPSAILEPGELYKHLTVYYFGLME